MANKNEEMEHHQDLVEEHELEQREVHEVLVFLQNNGMSIVIALAIGIVAAFGVLFYRNGQQRKAEYAARALIDATTPEALMAVSKEYAGTASAPMAVLELAAQQFNEGAYDEALAKYEEFKNSYPDHGAALAVSVCMAKCQEAAGNPDAAVAIVDAFLASNPDHFMVPDATFTKARCYEQNGDLEKARTIYEGFVAGDTDGVWQAQAEGSLRYVNQQIRAQETAEK